MHCTKTCFWENRKWVSEFHIKRDSNWPRATEVKIDGLLVPTIVGIHWDETCGRTKIASQYCLEREWSQVQWAETGKVSPGHKRSRRSSSVLAGWHHLDQCKDPAHALTALFVQVIWRPWHRQSNTRLAGWHRQFNDAFSTARVPIRRFKNVFESWIGKKAKMFTLSSRVRVTLWLTVVSLGTEPHPWLMARF